ncbi:ABC transporter permease [Bacillus velezensis]|uniref:ABC transporter permease n=1 Tax=Bacillus velezensis TaxID=492670 RepID=UPI0038BB4D6D
MIRGVLISLIGFIEILLVGKLVFHTILTDHMFLFILTFLIVIGITLLFSLSTHNLFKNSRQVLPYTIVMFQYVLFGSGLMFPIESVPEFVKYIVYINPFYHMKNLLLSVWNWQQIINWQGIAYLVLVIFVCICLIYIKSRSKEY